MNNRTSRTLSRLNYGRRLLWRTFNWRLLDGIIGSVLKDHLFHRGCCFQRDWKDYWMIFLFAFLVRFAWFLWGRSRRGSRGVSRTGRSRNSENRLGRLGSLNGILGLSFNVLQMAN